MHCLTQAEMRAGWEKRGRALDFDLAVEVMGWRVGWLPPAYDGHFGAEPFWEGEGVPPGPCYWSGWCPSTDLNLTARAEQRVVEMGLARHYGNRLYLLTYDLPGPRDVYDYYSGEAFAAVATASAELRCRALLYTVRHPTEDGEL